ncbi:MAG: hypothetical protein GY770_06445 [Aestuariibacter sp.]|nr:hypothetical protein [Aestuariibacter sp.]
MSSELFYIDNQRVLLYKIINRLYLQNPGEFEVLCGTTLRYENDGNITVEYSDTQNVLKLKLDYGFTDMLSIAQKCEHCPGATYLVANDLNGAYFGSGSASPLHGELESIQAFRFSNVGSSEAKQIRRIEKEISITLTGVVGGLFLEEGRVALHRADSSLNRCPENVGSKEVNHPVSLRVINSRTKEVLAEYSTLLGH